MGSWPRRHYRHLLAALAVVSLALAILSAIQIGKGNFIGYEPELEWFGLPFGAFVWGDLFVFSLFWLVASLILIALRNPTYFQVVFFLFWFIRSAGETVYWFLQQFHPDTIPWAEYFPQVWFLAAVREREFWILFQITWQVIATLCLFGLVVSIVKLIRESR